MRMMPQGEGQFPAGAKCDRLSLSTDTQGARLMKLPAAILAGLMLAACSQDAAPPAAGPAGQADDGPALLDDLAEEEIPAAAPVEAVPAEPEPPEPREPEFSFDNPPPEADQ